MAPFMKRLSAFRTTVPGKIIEAVVYAVLLALALIYFTGNGQFIYEAI